MALIDFDKMIEDLPESMNPLKPMLREMNNALNTLADKRAILRTDIVFVERDKGVVMRFSDGHYYRIIGVMSGTSPSLDYEDLGTEYPRRRD